MFFQRSVCFLHIMLCKQTMQASIVLIYVHHMHKFAVFIGLETISSTHLNHLFQVATVFQHFGKKIFPQKSAVLASLDSAERDVKTQSVRVFKPVCKTHTAIMCA